MLTFRLQPLQTEKADRNDVYSIKKYHVGILLKVKLDNAGCMLAAIFFVNDAVTPVQLKLDFCTLACVFH